MASTKYGLTTTLKKFGYNYSDVYARNIFNPNFKGNIITVWLDYLKNLRGLISL